MARSPERQPKRVVLRDNLRNQKLSEHFTRGEMRCPCCEVCAINVHLLQALEALRALAGGRPITVNSAFRCEKHNAAVGGAKNSQHLYGNAADIVIEGLPPVEVAKLAREIGRFKGGGIGLYRKFVHVDVGPGPRRWKGEY